MLTTVTKRTEKQLRKSYPDDKSVLAITFKIANLLKIIIQ